MRILKKSDTLISLPRGIKKAIVITVDIGLCFWASWFAFCLRFDEIVPVNFHIIFTTAVSVVLALPIFIKSGLYRAIFRFSGWYATLSLIKSIGIYTAFYTMLFVFVGFEGVPRSIGVIQPVLLFVGLGVSRLFAKLLLGHLNKLSGTSKRHIVALVYGAGSAGRQIVSGLQQSIDIKPIGFVDDDHKLWGASINGLPVYPSSEIPRLVKSGLGITDVLLAMPSAGKLRQREILASLSVLPIHVRLLPGLTDLANGVVKIEDIRDVEIDDVLGRESVPPCANLMHQCIQNKVVLVTGAGGSIGSELCRQVLRQKPDKLVLVELNEFALYAIERELGNIAEGVSIVPVLGSVLDRDKLVRTMRRHAVQTVYHAAAYKHVPMIEKNPAAGVWNNVFGTLRTVEAACQCGVESFVLVSTDKAVRPTNVMGCSKRLAELVLQAKSEHGRRLCAHATKLTMVRFGNVLGSSGSVVPVFREQIKNGGPVTVTHPDIIRYFMTIPEAAQLVIQAGAIGEGGDVMVLDMGEPVKIVDLAKRMIHLSGFSHRDDESPDGEIEIQFSGLRPGEKLYEELLIGDRALKTSHSRILRAIECALTWEDLEPVLVQLEAAVKEEDVAVIRSLLKHVVPEFNPQGEDLGSV